MIFLAALAFALALILDIGDHIAHWGAGGAIVTGLVIAGLLCMALHGCSWGWIPIRRGPRQQ